jgi:uncharacterized protein YkwD
MFSKRPSTTAAVVVSVIVAFGPVGPVGGVLKAQRAPVGTPAPPMSAHDVLVAMNGSRVHDGLAPLVMDARLNAAARDKMADMLRRHYFDHKSPDGKSIWDTIPPDKCAYGMAGENLARGFSDPAAMETSWMHSASHRENILNRDHKLTGIAVSQSPPMAVVLFADTCG